MSRGSRLVAMVVCSAVLLGVVAWVGGFLIFGRGTGSIDLMHPTHDYTPSLEHYCNVAANARVSLTTPPRTGLEAPMAQVAADYAPPEIHSDAQVVATALNARRHDETWDQAAALRSAARVDAYTKAHC